MKPIIYPRKNQTFFYVLHWRGKQDKGWAVFTGKVFRARTGAVLGVCLQGKRKIYLPWTSDKRIIEFYEYDKKFSTMRV